LRVQLTGNGFQGHSLGPHFGQDRLKISIRFPCCQATSLDGVLPAFQRYRCARRSAPPTRPNATSPICSGRIDRSNQSRLALPVPDRHTDAIWEAAFLATSIGSPAERSGRNPTVGTTSDHQGRGHPLKPRACVTLREIFAFPSQDIVIRRCWMATPSLNGVQLETCRIEACLQSLTTVVLSLPESPWPACQSVPRSGCSRPSPEFHSRF
jgi:hypothetical protein